MNSFQKVIIMRVYRWEHKEHKFGPLCGETEFPWRRAFRDHSYPHDDAEFLKYEESITVEDAAAHNFAWDSLENLIENMRGIDAEEMLLEWGFVLTEWEVTERYCVMWDGQVFFHRESAKQIS